MKIAEGLKQIPKKHVIIGLAAGLSVSILVFVVILAIFGGGQTANDESWRTAGDSRQTVDGRYNLPAEEEDAETVEAEVAAEAEANAVQSGQPGSSSDSSARGGSANANASNSEGVTAGSTGTGGVSSSGGMGGGSGSQTGTTAPATFSVTISVDAKTAYALAPSQIGMLASNGIFLGSSKATVQEGTTVRQLLDSTGLRVSARGAYVSGIGGLSEGDMGPQSGWLYSVNGTFPSSSATAYRLKAGDSVAWRYTCNQGEDVGSRR